MPMLGHAELGVDAISSARCGLWLNELHAVHESLTQVLRPPGRGRWLHVINPHLSPLLIPANMDCGQGQFPETSNKPRRLKWIAMSRRHRSGSKVIGDP